MSGVKHAFWIAVALAACEPALEDGAIFPECDEHTYEAVGWRQETPLGQTPEQVFAEREQSCNARVDWDDPPFRPSVEEPRWGQSLLTVSLTLDPDSARIARPARGSDRGCDAKLVIEGDLDVRSDDGELAVVGRVELDSETPDLFGFWVNIEDEAEGLKGDGEPNFQFRVVSMDECAGTLTLTRTDADSQRRSTVAQWMAAEPD